MVASTGPGQEPTFARTALNDAPQIPLQSAVKAAKKAAAKHIMESNAVYSQLIQLPVAATTRPFIPRFDDRIIILSQPPS